MKFPMAGEGKKKSEILGVQRRGVQRRGSGGGFRVSGFRANVFGDKNRNRTKKKVRRRKRRKKKGKKKENERQEIKKKQNKKKQSKHHLFDFGQFQLRPSNWPKSKLAEVENPRLRGVSGVMAAFGQTAFGENRI